ncbi:unnamed protein product [Arabidopsis halleri]
MPCLWCPLRNDPERVSDCCWPPPLNLLPRYQMERCRPGRSQDPEPL